MNKENLTAKEARKRIIDLLKKIASSDSYRSVKLVSEISELKEYLIRKEREDKKYYSINISHSSLPALRNLKTELINMPKKITNTSDETTNIYEEINDIIDNKKNDTTNKES